VEKIVCVHVLPILFMIGQIMFQGMSEHILVETSNYFAGVGCVNEQTEETDGLRLILLTLYHSDQGKKPNDESSIQSILDEYSVGTERTKSRILNQLKVYNHHVEHGPLRNVNFKSIIKNAKDERLVNYNIQNESQESNGCLLNVPEQDLPDPQYNQIMRTIIALKIIVGNKSSADCFDDVIGFRVLQGRSEYLYDCHRRLNLNFEKRKIKAAFLLANEKYRSKVGRKKSLYNRLTVSVKQ
jgi:hypothetical protein